MLWTPVGSVVAGGGARVTLLHICNDMHLFDSRFVDPKLSRHHKIKRARGYIDWRIPVGYLVPLSFKRTYLLKQEKICVENGRK